MEAAQALLELSSRVVKFEDGSECGRASGILRPTMGVAWSATLASQHLIHDVQLKPVVLELEHSPARQVIGERAVDAIDGERHRRAFRYLSIWREQC